MKEHKHRKSKSTGIPQNWKKLKLENKKRYKEMKEQAALKSIKNDPQKRSEDSTVESGDNSKEINDRKLTHQYTLSIAVPGSILDNAQSPELRTYLVGQIARAASIFNVDEIVVFDDSGSMSSKEEIEDEMMNQKSSCATMARILQYLECPQYLKKSFFPFHKDLQFVGLLNPLDAPHHLRMDEEFRFREGVVTEKQIRGTGSFVDVGLRNKNIVIDRVLQPGLRVSVEILSSGKKRKGKVIDSEKIRSEHGIYWGYNVRLAESLGGVFKRCPYEGGYDVTIGTSDKGEPLSQVELPVARHMIVIFGGLKGLEASLECDEKLPETNPRDLFKFYVNSCVYQGTRTIRTEEAILITLATLQSKLGN